MLRSFFGIWCELKNIWVMVELRLLRFRPEKISKVSAALAAAHTSFLFTETLHSLSSFIELLLFSEVNEKRHFKKIASRLSRFET